MIGRVLAATVLARAQRLAALPASDARALMEDLMECASIKNWMHDLVFEALAIVANEVGFDWWVSIRVI